MREYELKLTSESTSHFPNNTGATFGVHCPHPLNTLDIHKGIYYAKCNYLITRGTLKFFFFKSVYILARRIETGTNMRHTRKRLY